MIPVFGGVPVSDFVVVVVREKNRGGPYYPAVSPESGEEVGLMVVGSIRCLMYWGWFRGMASGSVS